MSMRKEALQRRQMRAQAKAKILKKSVRQVLHQMQVSPWRSK